MEETPLFESIDRSAREKNLIALLILAAGLIVGSLFIDVAQLFTGAGFAGKAVREHNLLEAGGKTWVAFTVPKVSLKVVSDSTCENCNPDEALTWLRRILPTVDVEKVEASSDEGKKLIATHDLRTLPSFVFDEKVKDTDFYKQAETLFTEKSNELVFDMNKIGLPVGKYIAAPGNSDDDVKIGNPDAKVKLMVFSEFQCQYCKDYMVTVKKILADYPDQVQLIFKNFPLPNHAQAENAALAAACANDQGRFIEYGDVLYARQADWGASTGTQKFKNYAWTIKGMNGRDFATCVDSNKYGGKVQADLQLAQDYNLSAAPATFVNNEFILGAATEDDLKKLIDQELSK